MLRLATIAGAAGLLLGLGGCTVYAPMQPTAPVVCQAGQAEIGASVQLSGRVEATAIYAPRPHLLVGAGLTGRPRLGDHNYLQTGQYEVSAGYYRALGEHWVLSGMGGFGQAHNHRDFPELGFLFFPTTYTQYEARYHKFFGQLGAAYVQPTGAALGVAYRLTYIGFNELRVERVGELPLTAMRRHELTITVRSSLSANGHWQLLGTAGLSFAGTPRFDDNLGGQAEYHANRTLLPVLLYSMGVGYTLRPTRR